MELSTEYRPQLLSELIPLHQTRRRGRSSPRDVIEDLRPRALVQLHHRTAWECPVVVTQAQHLVLAKAQYHRLDVVDPRPPVCISHLKIPSSYFVVLLGHLCVAQ